MKVDVVEPEGPALVLEVQGRINRLTADEFEADVKRAFEGTDRDVILDASGVTYVSSAGLRAFLRLWQDARDRSRGLHVCAVKPHIRQVFRTIGFDRIIPLEADRAAALVAVERRAASEG